MKVAVTGGTGFVGSHTVKALIDAGHSVRLLVRDPVRLGPALDPLGIERQRDIVIGDVTSSEVIEQLLSGCEAVVHAASVFSLDTRKSKSIRETNVTGTRMIIETARRLGLDPIVHVSSVVAIVPADGSVGPDSPVSQHPAGVYGQSKADSERLPASIRTRARPSSRSCPASSGARTILTLARALAWPRTTCADSSARCRTAAPSASWTSAMWQQPSPR
jgi:nucleoside-diphosphate-sugar epimerase